MIHLNNAHNMFNTYIYHQLPPTCFVVCYTIFRETVALLAQMLQTLQDVMSVMCLLTVNCRGLYFETFAVRNGLEARGRVSTLHPEWVSYTAC